MYWQGYQQSWLPPESELRLMLSDGLLQVRLPTAERYELALKPLVGLNGRRKEEPDMLSYLHAYHAGNFADVQKHAALVLALRMMQAKPSAIALFDTHAGSASYDLDHERARKTAEADRGIQKVWPLRRALTSEDWAGLLGPLSAYNRGDRVTRYPGSPALMTQYLRKQDQLCSWELHPAEGRSLADWAESKVGVRVIQDDGLAGLVRQLPPAQPRLLTLIDPSYEVKQEYETVATTLIKAWKACRHGVFVVWYPILPGQPHQLLQDLVRESPMRKVSCHEIRLRQTPERGMEGSGLLVVNPPWGFAERLTRMMDEVSAPDVLGVTVSDQWLIPE
jgi:23S rRNA (adenine2030-N6)-methyltransferase